MVEPHHYWKFRGAVEGLAGGEAPLRERIFWSLLSLGSLLERDIPEPMRATYLELQAHVTWKQDGDPDEGLFRSTLNAMSDDDAKKVAHLIVRIYEQTCRHLPPGQDDDL